jgi:two-component system cell cycle sensor histidine kinase/response regulator CckA
MGTTTAAYALPTGSETILVVAEQAELRALLEVSLGICGYRVLAAATGTRAWRLADKDGSPVSLLIGDRELQSLGGRGFAARLLARHPDLKFLLITSDPHTPAALDTVRPCLRQPFRPSTLVALVRRILDSSSRLAAPTSASASPSPSAEHCAAPGACT